MGSEMCIRDRVVDCVVDAVVPDPVARDAQLGQLVPHHVGGQSEEIGARVAPAQVRIAVHVAGLHAGDVVQVVTAQGSAVLLKVEAPGDFRGSYTMEAPGFARVEILREFVPGLPMLPALISNPVYFDPSDVPTSIGMVGEDYERQFKL